MEGVLWSRMDSLLSMAQDGGRPFVEIVPLRRGLAKMSDRTPQLSLLSTRELLDLSHRGNRAAYEELAARLLPALTRWASGRLPNHARRMVETGDLVQDVFLRTIQRLDRLDPKEQGGLQSYLRRAVTNRLRDELRRVKVRAPADTTLSTFPEDAPSALEQLVSREDLERYEAALERLRVEDREAVLARIDFGLDYGEIAKVLDRPSRDAARMAVNRALLRLAQTLAEDHG